MEAHCNFRLSLMRKHFPTRCSPNEGSKKANPFRVCPVKNPGQDLLFGIRLESKIDKREFPVEWALTGLTLEKTFWGNIPNRRLSRGWQPGSRPSEKM